MSDSEKYPLMPLPDGGYRARTRLNVVDSDGTAILYYELLSGGTRLTRNLCALLKRPYVLVDARQMPEPEAVASVLEFVEKNGIQTFGYACLSAGAELVGVGDVAERG